MKKHTKNFKKEISTFGRQLDNKIAVLGTELVLGKEDLYSITPITNADLLKSVMKEVNFESKQQLSIGQEINVKSGVLVNGEYEYIDFGNYFVYKNEYKAETNTYSHVCYDKMLNTMIDYVPLDITYPISLREYIGAIATKCGLEFANKNGTFANYDTLINEDHFSNGNYTFRDVLDYVAQLVGGWLCINDEGKLEVKYPELARNYDSVSGENINFTTNDSDKISKIVVDGKSTQETRSGKNLFDGVMESGGINNTTGNNQENSSLLRSKNYVSVKPNTAYIISNNGVGVAMNVLEYASDKLFVSFAGVITAGKPFTTSSTTHYIRFYRSVSNTDKIQVEAGSTATSYEPYGVMPSPDYPSEVKNIKGSNYININATPIQLAASKVQSIVNNSITIAATNTSNWQYVKFPIDNWEKLLNKTIIFKVNSITPSSSNKGRALLAFADNSNNMLSIIGQLDTAGTAYFTIGAAPEGATKMTLTLYANTTGTANIGDTVSYNELQLSTNDCDYVPYNNIQIKDVGKNLFNTVFEQNARNNTDGKTTVYSTNYIRTKNPIQVEPNITYTIKSVTSKKTSGGDIHYYDKNMNFIGRDEIALESVKTMPNGCYYINLQYYSGAGIVPEDIKTTQIEKGSTATSYEPYQSQTLNIDLQGNELCSNGDFNDELVVENGRAKIIKRLGESKNNIVSDVTNTYTNIKYFQIAKPTDYKNYAEYVMDYNLLFTHASATGSVKNWDSAENIGKIISGPSRNYFWIGFPLGATLEQARELLSNNCLYYTLAKPYEIDLGEVEPLNTFEGVNNVSLIANMDTNMQLTYTTDFEEFDKHFLKDVNVSFTKKYGAINSVVFSRGGGSDNIYRKDNASISKNGLTEIKINDNPFLEGDDRENFMQAVFDKLNGLEFYLLDVASTGIMYMELGDLYYFNMVEEKPSLKSGLVKSGMRKAQGSSGGKYICLLTNDEIKITQGLEENIYTDEPVRTETDYKTSAPTDNSIKNAIIQTNKNSAEILLKVNNDEVVSAINLSPEKIKISSAKLDIDAIATFTNSKLAEAGSTVINGANITTGSINCDRLNGGTINGQSIRGGSISITTGNYYFNMGTSTSNPNCSGLNVGYYGIKAYSNITATGFAITDSDTGKTQSINIYDGHGRVWYLTFTGGILTSSEYK